MSISNIEYLIQLHRSGIITDDDLKTGIRSMNVPETTPASPAPADTSTKHTKRNKKKKEKHQKQKYAQLYKSVIDELKKVLAQRNVSEL